MANRSSFDDSADDLDRPTPAAVETLNLALVTSTFVALALTYGSIKWTSLHSTIAIISVIAADIVFVLLIVPWVTAQWLGYDIDTLLIGDTLYSE